MITRSYKHYNLFYSKSLDEEDTMRKLLLEDDDEISASIVSKKVKKLNFSGKFAYSHAVNIRFLTYIIPFPTDST